MILRLLMLLLYLSNSSSETAQNHLKIVQAGDTVHFTCILTTNTRISAVWVRQRVGEKPLQIASAYQRLDVQIEKDLKKQNRFFIERDEGYFNLSITSTDESDSATYYCVTSSFTFEFSNSTDLIVKAGQLNIDSDYQRPALDPESPEEHLQCTVVTQSCAEKHNVYWFRHESAESPPAMIYTQESRSAQCKRSSDLNSTAHKCIYNLPKTNQDPGIYSCAVATCGEILFGERRKVGLQGAEIPWRIIALVSTSSNFLCVIVIILLGIQSHKQRQKDGIPFTVLDQSMEDITTTVSYTIYHKRL